MIARNPPFGPGALDGDPASKGGRGSYSTASWTCATFKTRIRLLNSAFTESCGSVVLVDQPAQHRPTTHLPAGGRRRGPARMRRLLIQGLVRPVPVVVADVLVQHHRQVPPAGDQEPV